MADVQIAVIDQQDTQITLAVPGVQGSDGGVSDGDKGDIVVSSFGATWTIDSGVVDTSKLGGDITTAGKALLDDADAAAQRTTLGLGTLATQSGTFSGTSSGTNTGDQTISLTGDVTGSGTGSFAATIANDAVTYAKIQNVSATDKLLGRSTAGAGDVEEISCTAAGRALLDDADTAAQRTTLGLVIGTDVQAYDADTAKIDVAQTYTAAQRGEITVLTSAATITPDFADSNNFSVELDTNATLANPSNLTAGQSGCVWITQDATGSRTLAYGSYWDFTGGTAPTLSTAAGAIDCLVYAVQSSTKITATLISNLS